ncbi:MAG: 2OG-Fe(II) oxygenase [Candidatus Thermoplasmatota archaeon]|nr:2OG-Fe(II) oxygenase [Candidatus Thermoplasmatota archaeon]
MQNISADAFIEPFPHMVFHNFYTNEELELIWEELKFYTKPNKLLDVEEYQGVVGYTKAKALQLDVVYKENRFLSNILEVSRKVFDDQILEPFSKISDCCTLAKNANYDHTKVRYYHNGDCYKPHTDSYFEFLAFSYFYKEPKRFEGGNLIFPKYDYEFSCDHNSLIIMPAWVEHGVSEVKIKDSDYYEGYGRYAITHFFGCKQK